MSSLHHKHQARSRQSLQRNSARLKLVIQHRQVYECCTFRRTHLVNGAFWRHHVLIMITHQVDPRSGSCLESSRAALELAPVLLLVHQITRENLYLSVKAPVLLQPLFILTLGTSGFNCWGIETGSSHPEREHPNMSACQHIIVIVWA